MIQYSNISQEDLPKFLRAYNLGVFREAVQDPRDASARSHVFYTSEGRYSLILDSDSGLEEESPFHLELLDHLSQRGFPCGKPIRRADGGLYGQLAGKCAALANYPDGISVEDVTSAYCACLGEVLALLHAAGSDFPRGRRSPFHPVAWTRAAQALERNDALRSQIPAQEIEDELDFLRQRWPKGIPSGVIHGSLTPLHALLDEGGTLTVIGFESACVDMWALDLAICLNAWGFEPDGAYNVGKSSALIESYRDARSDISDQEREAFPILVRGAALDAILKTLSSSDAPSPSELSRCMDVLRFHRMVDGAEGYGLA